MKRVLDMKIKYSWQGYKDGEVVPKAQGWFPVAFGYAHAWDWMTDDIRDHLRRKDIDEARIYRTEGEE